MEQQWRCVALSASNPPARPPVTSHTRPFQRRAPRDRYEAEAVWGPTPGVGEGPGSSDQCFVLQLRILHRGRKQFAILAC